jgi:hypothetical protein
MKQVVSAVLAAFIVVSGFHVKAQERSCGVQILHNHFKAINPDAEAMLRQTLKENVELAENKPNLKTTAVAGTIPVVFHIVLNEAQINKLGGVAGIERRIDSQMAVINRDFNRQNSDSTKIPAAFKPLYASADLKFGLARRKPDGTASSGYEIITTTSTGIEESGSYGSGMAFTDAKYTNGVPNAWNPDQYLNIWVVNMLMNGSNASILGIATPPSFLNYGIPGFSKNELGVVLNWGAFGVRTGISDYYISGITGGRTLTHELGHFFEIWHVWGDDDGKCVGSGGKDDGIADTPPQAEATYGCPSAPKFDACTPMGSGIMFNNFMDYVNDACMNMFTQGQVNVMKAQVMTGRNSYTLTQNPELLQYPTAVNDMADAGAEVNMYPNPATNTVYFSGAKSLESVKMLDLSGRVVKQEQVTGNGLYSIDISGLTKGVYLVQCTGADGTVVKKLIVQ